MRHLKRVAIGIIVVALVSGAATLGPRWLKRHRAAQEAAAEPQGPPKPVVALAPDLPDAISVPTDVAQQLGIQVQTALPAADPIVLEFSGTLTLDAERYTAVRSRFSGEVVELPAHDAAGEPVCVGDRVRKGDLLAVVWSRELGEKKSELTDALSRLYLDQVTLKRLQELYTKGDVPERSVRDAERNVEADQIAVDRVVRTLEAWRVSKADVAAVRQESENFRKGNPTPNEELVQQWARVEVRAPFDGVILERNIAVGAIVENDDDLFKIGDLLRLRVVAYAYEEDLPRLDALPPESRKWTISVPAAPGVTQSGTIDRIGQIIDPAQHTALVMGWVDNPAGQLRVGQFIRATVELAPPGGEVEIPSTALVERGEIKIVFVQPDTDQHVYQMRTVTLSRRLENVVTVRTNSAPATSGLQSGDRVVTAGAVQMLAVLRDLQAQASVKQPSVDASH